MIKRWMGALWLKLFGWRTEGTLPESARFVMIAAPHTSNWDLPFMLATSWVLGVRISWLGKHTLFRPPYGWFMRWLGGIPVDRRQAHNMVARVVEIFGESPSLVVAIPPEGTRKRAPYWKSGFYHIAAGAKLPIALGFLDYGRKVSGVGPALTPSGDLAADMATIRAFYQTVRGKFPDKETVPRLREEDAPVNEAGSSTSQ